MMDPPPPGEGGSNVYDPFGLFNRPQSPVSYLDSDSKKGRESRRRRTRTRDRVKVDNHPPRGSTPPKNQKDNIWNESTDAFLKQIGSVKRLQSALDSVTSATSGSSTRQHVSAYPPAMPSSYGLPEMTPSYAPASSSLLDFLTPGVELRKDSSDRRTSSRRRSRRTRSRSRSRDRRRKRSRTRSPLRRPPRRSRSPLRRPPIASRSRTRSPPRRIINRSRTRTRSPPRRIINRSRSRTRSPPRRRINRSRSRTKSPPRRRTRRSSSPLSSMGFMGGMEEDIVEIGHTPPIYTRRTPSPDQYYRRSVSPSIQNANDLREVLEKRRQSPSRVSHVEHESRVDYDEQQEEFLEGDHSESGRGQDVGGGGSLSLDSIYEEMAKTERLRREVEEAEKLKMFQMREETREEVEEAEKMELFETRYHRDVNELRGEERVQWNEPDVFQEQNPVSRNHPFEQANRYQLEFQQPAKQYQQEFQEPPKYQQEYQQPQKQQQQVFKQPQKQYQQEFQQPPRQYPQQVPVNLPNPVVRDQPKKVNTPTKEVVSEVLKPGNYLIVCWDAEALGGNVKGGSFYQLSAFMPHGVDFSRCILPEDVEEDELATSGIFFKQNNKYFGRVNHQTVSPVSTKLALLDFLEFLERGKRSTRPNYDGILLLSHIQEVIPSFLKVVKKHDLWNRLKSVVSGIGDLCTYIAACHMTRIMSSKVVGKDAKTTDLSISTVFQVLFNIKNHFIQQSLRKSKATYEILEHLLEGKPSYANFYRNYLNPLECKMITMMVNFRTVDERVKLFLPMQQFIAIELAEQQVELVMEGVYAPSSEDETQYFSEPQKVAHTMCRILVTSGFDFDRLIALYQEDGLAEVELKLRSVFLEKMAGRPRAAVDQTIKTTRLVISFFRQNGHRSVQELMKEAEEKHSEMIERIKHRKEEEGQKMLKESEEDKKKEYMKKFQDLNPAKEYFFKRLDRQTTIQLPGKKKEDFRNMAHMMVDTLIQANLHLEPLKTNFMLNFDHPEHHKMVIEHLSKLLANAYKSYGPVEVKLEQFVYLVIDFLKAKVFLKEVSERVTKTLRKKKIAAQNAAQKSAQKVSQKAPTNNKSNQASANITIQTQPPDKPKQKPTGKKAGNAKPTDLGSVRPPLVRPTAPQNAASHIRPSTQPVAPFPGGIQPRPHSGMYQQQRPAVASLPPNARPSFSSHGGGSRMPLRPTGPPTAAPPPPKISSNVPPPVRVEPNMYGNNFSRPPAPPSLPSSTFFNFANTDNDFSRGSIPASSVIIPEGVPLVRPSNPRVQYDQEKSRALDMARINLDNAIQDLAQVHECFMADFRIKLLSLSSVKVSIISNMEPMVALCGGNMEHITQIAEHVIRLLSYLGFNLKRLSALYESSEGTLAGNLFNALRERPGFLPPGVSNEALVEYVVNHFKVKK